MQPVSANPFILWDSSQKFAVFEEAPLPYLLCDDETCSYDIKLAFFQEDRVGTDLSPWWR
jgi:hypothetical protein